MFIRCIDRAHVIRLAPITLFVSILFACTDQDTPRSKLFAYSAFPDVIKTDSGKIIVVFYNGSEHAPKYENEKRPSKGGRIMFSESLDEGKTWSVPISIVDTPFDDRDPSIFQASDGRLLLNFFVRVATNTSSMVETFITESSDEGKTWKEPRRVMRRKATTSPIRALKDGRLAMTVYEPPGGCTILFSKDNGRTWGDASDIGGYGNSDLSEPDVVEVGNKLIAYMRSDVTTMRSAESTNGGKTWSPLKDCGFVGAAPYIYNYNNEAVLLAHRIPTTSIKLWFPKLDKWTDNFIVDYDMEANGAYPSLTHINAKKFLIVYYYEHEKDVDSSIRIRTIELVTDYLHVSDDFTEIAVREVVTF